MKVAPKALDNMTVEELQAVYKDKLNVTQVRGPSARSKEWLIDKINGGMTIRAKRAHVTEHVPIFYWHEEQRKAAEAAGASFDILEGPSPFGGFGEAQKADGGWKSALCAESTEAGAIPGGAPRICFAIPR